MKRHLLYSLLLLFVPLCMQAQNVETESNNSTDVQPKTMAEAQELQNKKEQAKDDQYYNANIKDEKPKTARPELPKSALEYMLQRPRVMKKFPHKEFGDHAFLDIAAGPTAVLGNENLGIYHINTPKILGTVMLGDWFTPSHGARIGFVGGQHTYGSTSNSYIGAQLDYMLNMTANSQYEYTKRKKVEVYGIAGFEYLRISRSNEGKSSYGAHLGLQLNAKIGNYWGIFVEPRISIFDQAVIGADAWRKYTPAASVLLGTSYQVGDHLRQQAPIISPYKTFKDGLFVSAGASIGGLFYNGFTGMKDYKSAGAEWSIGKWFSPVNGTRITLITESFTRENASRKMKNVGLQVDYLLNLTNSLGSYNPNRLFDVNFILGADMASASSGNGRHWIGGGGIGLQGIAYLTHKRVSGFFIEPRIDVYGNGYIQKITTGDNFDARAKVVVGFMLLRAPSPIKIKKVNKDFYVNWKNRWYLESGLGATMPIVSSVPASPSKFVGPTYSLAVGKWFNAISGVHTQYDGSWLKYNGQRIKEIEWKLDYDFNFSNAFVGYDPARKVEFIGMAGVNVAIRSEYLKGWFGVNGGLKALFHINDMTSLYLQPQFSIYSDKFMHNNFRLLNYDAIGSVLAGAHFDMNGYNKVLSNERFDATKDKHNYISASAGVTFKPHQLNTGADYGASTRISFGHYYAPFYSIRYTVNGSEWNEHNKKMLDFGAGADFVLDVTTMAYNYNPDRLFTLRALAGFDLNLQYRGGKRYFAPFLHAGAQLGVKAAKNIEIYVEPSLNRQLTSQSWDNTRANKAIGMIQAGVKYDIQKKQSKVSGEPMIDNQYASLSVGPVITTENATNSSPFGRKPGYAIAASYERWLSEISGLRGGLTAQFIKSIPTCGESENKQEYLIHADYLFNFNAIANGGKASNRHLQWIGGLGVGYVFGTQKDLSKKEKISAPAITGSLQARYKINDQFTVFAEPNFFIATKGIKPYTPHGYEGCAKLLIGTTYRF